ncbi:SHC SH2 domain-binding protein 1 isoform X2 [Hemicordylus capensis]|uniref:SHC SH2 domain-binding protein 1 isoform X2 n=1 Tax=Hemicordylus capensis TaxID=884348 RepID=UPI002302B8BE|nr:SHC SH2 domain-binding protein 1 isoform X2 [Hemicordylus capensis]
MAEQEPESAAPPLREGTTAAAAAATALIMAPEPAAEVGEISPPEAEEERTEVVGMEIDGRAEEPSQPGSATGSSEPAEVVEVPPLEDKESDGQCCGCHDDRSCSKSGTVLQRLVPERNGSFPDTFQTDNLLFYERFKTYQDFMLDCKASEVREFTADYLEKVLEPSGWRAVWHTNVFEVLVEVADVECSTLKAVVRLAEPFLCETQGGTFTPECIQELLELKERRLPLQELWVVFDESGEFDQTALALEHVRFFYKHIWRSWDEEDDDDFDYFVRCVEPRLRLYYDIIEDRVPFTLVANYHSLLSQCEEQYRMFLDLRNSLSCTDSDSEAENISMVEGMKLYDGLEHLKQKLKLIENPLLRYVFGYQKHAGFQAKGARPSGTTITHVVSATMMSSLLQCLFRDKLSPESCNKEIEIQFHSDPLSAMTASHEGDRIVICPGHYIVEGVLYIADSVELEGYGLPDDIVIEKRGKGDAFVECTGADVKISSMKLVQHDAVEGILSVHQGKTTMENCVLQCETTGVAVRASAELSMKNSDLYGAKGAGIEIYPGSTCTLMGNGIHHCKEGILIKDFLEEHYEIPKITMVNNVIHNNEGYGVVLVKPATSAEVGESAPKGLEEEIKDTQSNGDTTNTVCEGKRASEEFVPCGTDVSGHIEGNSEIATELSAASLKKSQLRKKRLSNLGIMEADENLMSQEMFVSIVGNQFKRNGKGSFGTFLY